MFNDINKTWKSLKTYVGVIFLDCPRYIFALKFSNLKWIRLCNRNESVQSSKDGFGVICQWQFSSTLHAPTVFPFLGKMLMEKALQCYPIHFAETPKFETEKKPDVSIIIGHRGLARLPHLLITLKSIAAQKDVSLECLVVEQSSTPQINEMLPNWVRYIHDPYEHNSYNRSRTFNIGFVHAKGKLLVLHDNDMAVPSCYARSLLEKFDQGYDVINLKRFIFYLNQSASVNFCNEPRQIIQTGIDFIVQNLEAGGSVAVSKEAFKIIGGFDEDFIGWGGEDVEFWERCLTQNVWNYTFLPIVHFWHPPQAEKTDSKDSNAMTRYKVVSRLSPNIRITSLVCHNSIYFS